jgi:hypothetical protein
MRVASVGLKEGLIIKVSGTGRLVEQARGAGAVIRKGTVLSQVPVAVLMIDT